MVAFMWKEIEVIKDIPRYVDADEEVKGSFSNQNNKFLKIVHWVRELQLITENL